jgi:hypothetical protein
MNRVPPECVEGLLGYTNPPNPPPVPWATGVPVRPAVQLIGAYRFTTNPTVPFPAIGCGPMDPHTDEFNPESQDGAPLSPDVCKEECGDLRHFQFDGCDDGNWN